MSAEMGKHLTVDLLLESSIDAMIAIGNDENITAWNNKATILFDWIRDKTYGKHLFNVLPSLKEDVAFREAIRFARDGKKSFLPASGEFIHRRHIETHIIPLRKADTIVGIMLLMHNVSHRIAKELELQKLNEELQYRLREWHRATNELAQLTHITSHNIRTPIREIYTIVEGLLVTEAGVISHSGRAAFRRIQSSLNRMNLLLDDIITLTQINLEDRPANLVNLEALLQELRTQFAKKLRDSKTMLTVGELCEVRAHRNQLLLLLQQIFSNVIRFAAPGPPHIHIHCEKTCYTSKNNDHSKNGQYYLLTITHNGSIFDNIDPRATLQVDDNTDIHHYTGSVIAIMIAGRIMEVHSGFLEMESTEQGHTKINCFFPVKESALK